MTQSPRGQQEFLQEPEARAAQEEGCNHNVPLASMTSLRGPSARSNRAMVLQGMEHSPTITHPALVSFPQHAKKWQLGVGKCPGQEQMFGLFAISSRTTGIIFHPNQLICPYLRHVQSVKPTKLRHHAWVHNGIQEGLPGCEYTNASQNEDSPAKWARMAIVEEQANAQIRRIPHTKGGGMGIFATEDIWHGQEVMLVNPEQTTDPEENSRP